MADVALVITRTLNAKPEDVFKAWLDPKQVADWYGPEGFTNEIHEYDAREGGTYRLTMKAPNGEYVEWGVEMAGAAAMANQGVTVTTFPYRTIFSVSLNPLRDGKNFGTMTGPIFKCPKDKPPSAGKHCNAVEGSTQHGRGNFNADSR